MRVSGAPEESVSYSLRTFAPGLALAVLTVLFGQLLGVVFGLNEEAIQSRLHSSAVAVGDSIYHSDEAAMKKVEDYDRDQVLCCLLNSEHLFEFLANK